MVPTFDTIVVTAEHVAFPIVFVAERAPFPMLVLTEKEKESRSFERRHNNTTAKQAEG